MELTPDVIKRRYSDYRVIAEEQISYMETVVMDILDRNYDLLYDYFCNALDRGEEYKILRARRCQVLFQLFLPIILKNEPDIRIHGIFISDHAIAKYKEEILKTSALILDDIVIHGRGLQELYEELDPGYEYDNIHVYVHKIARTADAMSKELKDKLERDSEIYDWEWRELSTQLVNAIYATATPYVSFVETYISGRKLDLERTGEAFTVSDYTNEDQSRIGTKAYVIFEKEMLPCIIGNGGYDACVRYYENEKMSKTVYVPYVFIKSVTEKDIDIFCNNFAEHLGSKHNALVKELLTGWDNDLQLKYKAVLANVLLNRIYSLYLDHKYPGLFDFSIAEWATLAMCFGNAVTEDVEKLTYDDVCSLMDLEFCQAQCDEEYEEDQELLKGLEQAIEDEAENEVLPLYFYFNRQLDEESARKREKRKKGLSVNTFYSKLGDNVHNTSKLQLRSWDAGTAACDTFVINNKLVALYARAGEQSFRYMIDKIETLEENINSVPEGEPENGQSSEEKLSKKLMRQFWEDNHARLCEWKIPKIFC